MPSSSCARWCGSPFRLLPGALDSAEEQAAQYKKRARNTVMESIWQIKDLILYYYS